MEIHKYELSHGKTLLSISIIYIDIYSIGTTKIEAILNLVIDKTIQNHY
jgi:hypothetical protein